MKRQDFWTSLESPILEAHFEPPLNKWISIIREYSVSSEDHLYWYNKTATLSTFAGAIWKSNGNLLQEYKETEGQRKGKWRSNADLWFKVHNEHYIAKATQKWVSFAPGANDKYISKRAQSTYSDSIESWQGSRDVTPIAITFVTAYKERNFSPPPKPASSNRHSTKRNCALAFTQAHIWMAGHISQRLFGLATNLQLALT